MHPIKRLPRSLQLTGLSPGRPWSRFTGASMASRIPTRPLACSRPIASCLGRRVKSWYTQKLQVSRRLSFIVSELLLLPSCEASGCLMLLPSPYQSIPSPPLYTAPLLPIPLCSSLQFVLNSSQLPPSALPGALQPSAPHLQPVIQHPKAQNSLWRPI
ncbi:hypothetical protein TgHK011_005033 [Trichoderma gracile]|nr:hypothetical protein TgHK011_005033 [Trichoderma gracile]